VTTILLATDADWVRDEVSAALLADDVSLYVVRDGRQVRSAVATVKPDLVITDLQIGTMGGMAVCMDLRLETSGGRLPRVGVLMLLDRAADLFLAQRCEADGWLVKPLDSLRLRRATRAILGGGTWTEGLPAPVPEALPHAIDEATEALPTP
jgi:DNA-binding response OmpR family regulator